MDTTFENFAANDQRSAPKQLFGFRASAKDGESSGDSPVEDEEEEKKILESEVNAFKDSIKIGEQKPNVTTSGLGVDKADVDGKDTVTEQEIDSEDAAKRTSTQEDHDEEMISEEEGDQNEEVYDGAENGDVTKGEVTPSTRQLKGL